MNLKLLVYAVFMQNSNPDPKLAQHRPEIIVLQIFENIRFLQFFIGAAALARGPLNQLRGHGGALAVIRLLMPLSVMLQ